MWLYVVDADAGTASDGTVTLTQLDQDAIAFSDRPQRVARRLPIAELVSAWADLGFVDDPPNATIAYESGGRERVLAVELTDPVLDGDRLTFSYLALDPAAPVLPADLGPAAVFIDDAGDPAAPLATVAAVAEEQFSDTCLRNRSQYVTRGPVSVCQSQLRITPPGQAPYVQWDVYISVEGADEFGASVDIDVPAAEPLYYSTALDVEGALAKISWQSPVIPAADSLSTDVTVEVETVSAPVRVRVSCNIRWEDVLGVYEGSCSSE
jgi:hypothetical protein